MATRLRSDINVTPLVDIVFVLLIVFLTLVPVLPRALAADLPQPGGGSPGEALRLTLLADGNLVADGRAVSARDLTDLVRRRGGRIVLQVDPDLPFQRAASAMDRLEGLRPGARIAVTTGAPRPGVLP